MMPEQGEVTAQRVDRLHARPDERVSSRGYHADALLFWRPYSTKRMAGRLAASMIASASAMSFLRFFT